MKLTRGAVILVLLFFFIGKGYPQQTKVAEKRLSVDYMQIDESLNYGLVFSGPGIGFEYSKQWENPNRIIAYSAGLGFNFVQTRKIAAANLHISPLKFSWLYKFPGKGTFAIGPYFIADYNYQVYPDLQSGYSFWFTHLSIGGALQYSFRIKQEAFKISAETSLFGITSRSEKYEDPYFYDLDVGYVLRSVNSDFKFLGDNKYDNSKIELKWQHKPGSRLAFAYSYVSYNYVKEPKFAIVNHRLSIIFLPHQSIK
jgi:hypothetical protein